MNDTQNITNKLSRASNTIYGELMNNTNNIINKLNSMKLELVDLSKIIPDPLNTKNHPDEQIELIAKSISKRWTNPILIDDDGIIVAGHGRRLAAIKLGLKKVPVIVLHNLTESERIQYQIFDNKSAEMSEWNFENLQAQMDRLTELGADIEATGWTVNELEESLQLLDDTPKEMNFDKLDNVPPIPETVKTNIGDVWILGKHRVMCGDSTSEEDVDKLMDGVMADLVFTDPPYGVSYKGTNNPNGREWKIIKNDTLRDNELFLFLFAAFQNIKKYLRKERAFYIWFANSNYINFLTAIEEVGLKSKQVIIWDKGMVLGHSDYHWAYEPCFYGCHKDENCKWFGDRTQKTLWKTEDWEFEKWSNDDLVKLLKSLKYGREIWSVKRDNFSEYLHPTQKPVELADRAIMNNSLKGEVVLDLFGGGVLH